MKMATMTTKLFGIILLVLSYSLLNLNQNLITELNHLYTIGCIISTILGIIVILETKEHTNVIK